MSDGRFNDISHIEIINKLSGLASASCSSVMIEIITEAVKEIEALDLKVRQRDFQIDHYKNDETWVMPNHIREELIILRQKSKTHKREINRLNDLVAELKGLRR